MGEIIEAILDCGDCMTPDDYGDDIFRPDDNEFTDADDIVGVY